MANLPFPQRRSIRLSCLACVSLTVFVLLYTFPLQFWEIYLQVSPNPEIETPISTVNASLAFDFGLDLDITSYQPIAFQVQLNSVRKAAYHDIQLDQLDDYKARGQHTKVLRSLQSAHDSVDYAKTVTALQKNWMKSEIRSTIADLGTFLYPWIVMSSTYQDFHDFYTVSTRGSRGIVVPVSTKYLRWAVHSISIIREVHNCTLPIECAFLGPDDLSEPAQAFLLTLGPNIRLLDLEGLFDQPKTGLPAGFAIKPFVMLASSFTEIMLVDADAVFLRSPELLFETNAYKSTGTAFFRDRAYKDSDPETLEWINELISSSRYIDEIRGSSDFLAAISKHEQESGVVLVDKRQGFYAMLLVAHMNLADKRERLTYKRFYGDKETFWLSFAITDTRFSFYGPYAGGLGACFLRSESVFVDDLQQADSVCLTTILHTMEDDSGPLWLQGSLMLNKNRENNNQTLRYDAWVSGEEGTWGADSSCMYLRQGPPHALPEDSRTNLEASIAIAKRLDSDLSLAGLL